MTDSITTETITSEQFDFLAARAGLSLSPEQKAEIIGTYHYVAAMVARNSKPRGRAAEPAHVFIPGEGVVA
jgi:hypothetical protein